MRVLGFWKAWRTPCRKCLSASLDDWDWCEDGSRKDVGCTHRPSFSKVFTLYSGDSGFSCWSAKVTWHGVIEHARFHEGCHQFCIP